jgi:lysophospholipase L1-like esterase
MMNEKKAALSPKKRKIYAVVIILLVTLMMSSVIEMTSILILESKNKKTFPFLISFPKKEKIYNRLKLRYNYLDPHLGYSHNNTLIRKKNPFYLLDGFAVYRNKKEKPKDVIKIIALGGSTTDPAVRHNWPKQLNDVIKEKGINCEIEVLNGGVAGYSSNQELLKMLRDCLPLKPAVIICMNGVNEIGHSVKNHPMVETYQQQIFQHIVKSAVRPAPIFPNTLALLKSVLIKEPEMIKGLNYGPKVNTTPWDQWKRNIIIMNAAAREFNVEYFCFLQPILGVGDYVPTAEENKMLMEKGKGYLQIVKDFYDIARPISKDIPFCIDITGIFDKTTGMYQDPRHPNKEGNRIIAERVFKELEERSLIIKNILQNKNTLSPGRK